MLNEISKPLLNIENTTYFSVSGCGEMKLGLFLTETHLQVDIVSARNVTWNSKKVKPENLSAFEREQATNNGLIHLFIN